MHSSATSRADSFSRPWFLAADASTRSEGDRVFAEQEWWFDAERLHTDDDVERMKEATRVVLDEVTIINGRHGRRDATAPEPAAAADAPAVENDDKSTSAPMMIKIQRDILTKPGNDIGREMEVRVCAWGGGVPRCGSLRRM